MKMHFMRLGRCSCAFWLGVAFDILGLGILLLGVFANFFFYDFLIYAGAIIIFLSLIWWVVWYTGNIEVPPEQLEDDVGLLKKDSGVVGLVRRLSSRLTNGFRSSFRSNKRASGQSGNPQTQRSPQAGPSNHPKVLPVTHSGVYTVFAGVAIEAQPNHPAMQVSTI
ncbi:transmembrane protein 238-like [Polyodon spathula]|uniref:transmembrane protein 238-like n=1 Tax=Polyodon spathula TaxID=7913 RepID=UPI001B7E8E8F|nr:transmembrane protein 238-like [Polyodon spathula]XP_041134124.1 transmembrane protein 238-like [Polyodon spathula]